VRLSTDIIRRLDNAAKKMGISARTSVIKLCLSSFLDYFEKNGVTALPLNWKDIIRETDGRSQKQDNLHADKK